MGNTANLSYLVDFYLIEAAEFEVRNALAKNPEVGRKALEKTLEEIEEHQAWLIPGLALALRDYMFLACSGEARHCEYMKDNKAVVEERGDVYKLVAEKFKPSREGFQGMRDIFENCEWRTAFGGKAWAKIAKTGASYGSVTDTVFIDTAASLAHNNGTMFSKTEARYVISFDPSTYKQLTDFLHVQHTAPSLLTASHIDLDRSDYWYPSPYADLYYGVTRRGLRIARKAAVLTHGDNGNLPEHSSLKLLGSGADYNYDEPSYETISWGKRDWFWSKRLYIVTPEPKVQSWMPHFEKDGLHANVYDFCANCAPMLWEKNWRSVAIENVLVRVRGGKEYEYADDSSNEKIAYNPFEGAYLYEYAP